MSGEARPDAVPRWLPRAFMALSAEVYGLLVFGAAVRVHRAGLSCPDWPLCFGELIPEMDLQVFLEWGHRVLAGTVSLVFLALAVVVARLPAARSRAGAWLLGAGGVLLLQIILGGLTVLHLLADWSVTLHLLCGNLFLAMLVRATLGLRGGGEASLPPGAALRPLVLALGALFVTQLALGGLVASNHAGTVCTEWPACQNGLWFPSWAGPFRWHLLHRLGAYALLITAGAVAWKAAAVRGLRAPAGIFFGLVCVQALLGIGNVLWSLPQTLAIGHSGLAGLLTLTFTVLVTRVMSSSSAQAPSAFPVDAQPEPA